MRRDGESEPNPGYWLSAFGPPGQLRRPTVGKSAVIRPRQECESKDEVGVAMPPRKSSQVAYEPPVPKPTQVGG